MSNSGGGALFFEGLGSRLGCSQSILPENAVGNSGATLGSNDAALEIREQ